MISAAGREVRVRGCETVKDIVVDHRLDVPGGQSGAPSVGLEGKCRLAKIKRQ